MAESCSLLFDSGYKVEQVCLPALSLPLASINIKWTSQLKKAWFQEASSNRAEWVHIKASTIYSNQLYGESCLQDRMHERTLTDKTERCFHKQMRREVSLFQVSRKSQHRTDTTRLSWHRLEPFSRNGTRLILSNNNNYTLLLLRAVFESDPQIPLTRAAKTNLLSTFFFILLLSVCMRCLLRVQLLQSEDESPSGNEEEVEKITLKCLGWCAFAKFPPLIRRGTVLRGETTCFLFL